MTSRQAMNRWVEGVAVVDDRIYVVCDQLDVISVYRLDSLQPVGDIKVGGLQLPNDLAACCQSRQLYVADMRQCVWRVSVDTGRAKRWIPSRRAPEDPSPLSLSVTSRQVLVTSYDGDVLSLYSSDGRLVKSITLPDRSRARHAVLTAAKTFVVCRTMPRHDVAELDFDGHVIHVCDAELNWPRRLAPAVGGDVIVLDSDRLLVVDARLKLKRVLLTTQHDGLDGPWRLNYTSNGGWLVLGEACGRVTLFSLIRSIRPSTSNTL